MKTLLGCISLLLCFGNVYAMEKQGCQGGACKRGGASYQRILGLVKARMGGERPVVVAPVQKKKQECPVCFEEFDAKDLTGSFGCNDAKHNTCKPCHDSWAAQNADCPICRQ